MDILSSTNVGEFSRNVVGSLNPLAMTPIELATGKDIYYNRNLPRGTDLGSYVMNNLPLLPELQQEVFGMPGSDRSVLQRILNDRLTGLGLPIRQISAEQQQQQQQENRDQFIDDPLQGFNNSQDRYYISTGDDFTYRVNDQLTGAELGIFPTPQEAIAAAQRLPGANYQEPFVDPRRYPNQQDVGNVLRGMNG